MNITETQFSLSLTIYDLPNIIIPFFGGVAIDKLGPAIGVNLSTLDILIGNAVICLGVYLRNYWTWIAGYAIFGLGGEIQLIAGAVINYKWFSN